MIISSFCISNILHTMALHPTISTGRGGLGNMTQDKNEANEANEVVMEESSEVLHHGSEMSNTVSIGRGGMGNIYNKKEKEGSNIDDTQDIKPTISPVFSTGRGGIGNINSNGERDRRNSHNNGNDNNGIIKRFKSLFK